MKSDSDMKSRWLVFVIAMLHVAVGSGIAYGWAALTPLMKDDEWFSESTAPWEVFNMIGTLGIGANALCKLPMGVFLDACGPRKTSALGGLLLTIGALLMAYGNRESCVQIGAGYFLIGFAGPFVQTPCFQFTELFLSHKGTATSVLVICFELSTGVFVIFDFLHGAGYQLRDLFCLLACAGVVISFTALLLWPDRPHKGPARFQQVKDIPHREWLKNASFMEQVQSDKFWYLACFMIIHILRQGYMLVTVADRSKLAFGEQTGGDLEQAFSVILPLGFLPMTIFTALGLANRLLKLPDMAFVVASSLSVLWAFLLLLWWVPSFVLSFLIFPFARQLVFSTFFTYAGATFGFKTFGKLTGAISTVAGLVQLVLQQLLPDLAIGGWPGGPSETHRWRIMDGLMTVLPVALLYWPVNRVHKRHFRTDDEHPGMFSPAEVLLG